MFFQKEFITGSTRRKREGKKERASERERQTLIAARFDGPVGLHRERETETETETEREHEMGERDYATVERA